jgi:hypothetical protein
MPCLQLKQRQTDSTFWLLQQAVQSAFLQLQQAVLVVPASELFSLLI